MSDPMLPPTSPHMSESPALALPSEYNVTTAFLDDALARGWGARPAIRMAGDTWSYARLAEATTPHAVTAAISSEISTL